MRRFYRYASFVLLLLASSLPTQSFAAINNPRMSDAEYCTRHFQGSYRPDANPRHVEIGDRHVANFGLNVRVVFCVDAGADSLDSPLTRMSEWKDVLYIGLGSAFARELAGSLNAIIAHEIAHFVVPGGQMCSGQSRDKYIACESSVDEAAALVVGKSSVISMLNNLSNYIRSHKESFENAENIIEDIRKRTEMLHRADLPN